MIFTPLILAGAYLINLEKSEDVRGFFARCWCRDELAEMGLDSIILQVNNSMSLKKGTLRGLHFQWPPKAESKFVRCISGAIWDVIVDIRADSPTFGKWYGTELNEDNRTMMYVPKGFAHGFQTLTDNVEHMYIRNSTVMNTKGVCATTIRCSPLNGHCQLLNSPLRTGIIHY